MVLTAIIGMPERPMCRLPVQAAEWPERVTWD
jgi:hypothetical protein